MHEASIWTHGGKRDNMRKHLKLCYRWDSNSELIQIVGARLKWNAAFHLWRGGQRRGQTKWTNQTASMAIAWTNQKLALRKHLQPRIYVSERSKAWPMEEHHLLHRAHMNSNQSSRTPRTNVLEIQIKHIIV